MCYFHPIDALCHHVRSVVVGGGVGWGTECLSATLPFHHHHQESPKSDIFKSYTRGLKCLWVETEEDANLHYYHFHYYQRRQL